MSWLVVLGFVVLPPIGSRTIVTSTSIEIYVPLVFAPGSARLPDGADKTIAAIAATIDGNPSLLVLAVEAEVTPADGDAFTRELVGLRRANAVRDRLVALGVSPSRLVAEVGAGEQRAIEFVVLQRADSRGGRAAAAAAGAGAAAAAAAGAATVCRCRRCRRCRCR